MRDILILSVISSCFASAFFTQATPFGSFFSQQQAPMAQQAPGIALPGLDKPSHNDSNDPSDATIISDVLGRERSVSIFASFSRDVESVAERLQDGSLNATVLAPSNAEIAKLPRKPWEDAQDYEIFGTADAYNGVDGESRAQRNLKSFVERHILTESPLVLGEKVATMAGNTVWVEEKDGKKLIQPGNIEVSSVADKVSNGEVWILKGVIN